MRAQKSITLPIGDNAYPISFGFADTETGEPCAAYVGTICITIEKPITSRQRNNWKYVCRLYGLRFSTGTDGLPKVFDETGDLISYVITGEVSRLDKLQRESMVRRVEYRPAAKVSMRGTGSGNKRSPIPYNRKLDFLTPAARGKMLGNNAGKVKMPTKKIPLRRIIGKRSDRTDILGEVIMKADGSGPVMQTVSAVIEAICPEGKTE